MSYGKLWPAHPKPLPDELLSSWIVRTAQANAIKLQTLSWMVFGNKSPWHRDVDRSAPDWLLGAMCTHTGLSYEDAYRCTLNTYQGRLFSYRRKAGALRWVMPLGHYGLTLKARGIQFCPACFAHDSTPYYRKQWRLALYTFCPTHHLALHDECPKCGQPIAYYRHDYGKYIQVAPGITCCWSCGFDYREAPKKMVLFPTEELESAFYEVLWSLENPMVDNAFDLGFFAVLHQLCRVMGMRSNHGKLLQYVGGQLHIETSALIFANFGLEHQSQEARHLALLCSLWILRDFQRRLANAWEARSVRYNLLTRDFSDLPDWYGASINRLCRGSPR